MEARDRRRIEYPDSDGRPIADNTLQFEWIVTIKENLDARRPDFVGGDLLWYPVEGEPRVRVAPDVLVAPGRPKGHRGSYKQWEEGDQPPAVVFEVLSPNNTVREMLEKLGFYDRHGVAEFYVVDPEVETVQIFVRDGGLREILFEDGYTSPILEVRFTREHGKLLLFDAAGERFRTFAELRAERDAALHERDAARAEADRLAEILRAHGIEPNGR